MILNIPPSATFQITTPRLLLRPYRPADAVWFYPMSQAIKDHLRRFEAGNSIMTIETLAEAQAVLQRMADDWDAHNCFTLAAFEQLTGDFACQIYIGPLSWSLPEFTLGYIAEKDHEGQGYVTEAARAVLDFVFQTLNAQRLSVECDDTNQRSYHVAERLGMQREAHFRQNRRHPDGTLTGTYHYGLLRSEWQALKAAQP
jgi:ribosomal-protein-alanine N-acetyltransferase